MEELKRQEGEVLQNTDHLYARTFEAIPDQEPQPINDYERDMLKNTKTATELLESEKTEEPIDVPERKAIISMVKVIALDRCGKHPLANPSCFSTKEKNTVKIAMQNILETLSFEEIKEQFNTVCTDKIFSPNADYTVYPVFNC